MDDQLWNLFLETGDPMGYLLYKATRGEKTQETDAKTDDCRKSPPAGTPPAAF